MCIRIPGLGFYVLTPNVWDFDNDPNPDNGTTTLVVQNDESGDAYVRENLASLNGALVGDIATAGNIHTTIAGGVGTLRALPPHCYGDPSVAKELADSGRTIVNGATVTPEPVTVFWIGTSRSTGEVLMGAGGASSPGLPWALHSFGLLSLATTAWTNVYVDPAANAGVALFGTWLGRFTPASAGVETMNGTPAPGGNDAVARLTTGTLATASRPYAAAQFQGRAVTLTAPYVVGPNGITGADVRFGMFGNGANLTHATDFFSTHAAEYGVRLASVTIPSSWDWTTYPNLVAAFAYRQGAATISGEVFCGLSQCVVTTDVGVSIASAAIGGRWSRDYIDETIFDRRIFTEHLLAYPGTRKQLWIELGCNGNGIRTLAQELADKRELIARFRAVFPDGKVLLITSYASSGARDGSSTDWRDADLQIADDSGVLVLDTYMAMPGYIRASALGYMADTVHYNDTGRAAWMAKIADLLSQCAALAA
jgi:hypothetical protein